MFGSQRNNDRYMENTPKNIMFDKRVYRGNPRLKERKSASEKDASMFMGKDSNQVRRKRPRVFKKHSTPIPVPGRQHMEVQTSQYLEQIHTEKEVDFAKTQTDPLLDKPSTPLFIPKPSGPSVSTQIEAGDLFDFDHEVEPILEVLIGKTLEQSLMEVLEETELAQYETQRNRFEQLRDREIAECQRLEEMHKRHQQEMERRRKQALEFEEQQRQIQTRVEAQLIAKEFVESLETSVFMELQERGFFDDPVQKEVSTVFMPALYESVERQVGEWTSCVRVIDEILLSCVENARNDVTQGIEKLEQEEWQRQQDEKLLARQEEDLQNRRRLLTTAFKEIKRTEQLREKMIDACGISLPAADEEDLTDDQRKLTEQLEEILTNFADGPIWKPILGMLNLMSGSTLKKIEQIDGFLARYGLEKVMGSLKSYLQSFMESIEEEESRPAEVSALLRELCGKDLDEDVLSLVQDPETIGDGVSQILESIKITVPGDGVQAYITSFLERKQEKANPDEDQG